MKGIEVRIGGQQNFMTVQCDTLDEAKEFIAKEGVEINSALKTLTMAVPIKQAIRFENSKGEEVGVNGKLQDEAVVEEAPPEAPAPQHKAIKEICDVCGRQVYVKASKSKGNPGRFYETCTQGKDDKTCRGGRFGSGYFEWRDDLPRVEQ